MTQEKKNKLSALSLVVLTTATIIIFFSTADTPDKVDTSLFKIDDGKKIERVLLESAADTVDLKYTGSRWTVNDVYAADVNMIKVLMATLLQHEPKRPVAESMNDSVARVVQKEGVHVTVFGQGEVVSDFYAGGNAAKSQAFFLQPGSGQAYLMVIPGYRVYVSGIFELDESGFRDKHVFPFRWENFKGLRVNFPITPSANFNVVLDEEKRFYTIEGMGKVDTAKLNAFLTDVSLLTVDQYGKAGELTDTASNNLMMEIIIEDVAQRKYRLKLFSGEKNGMTPALTGNDVAYFHPQRIRPILRPKSFFARQ